MELVKTDKEKNVIKPPLFTNTEKKKKTNNFTTV